MGHNTLLEKARHSRVLALKSLKDKPAATPQRRGFSDICDDQFASCSKYLDRLFDRFSELELAR